MSAQTAQAEPVGNLKVTIAPVRDIRRLGQAWRDLEAVADASFFQSWSWIGTWLRSLPEQQSLRVVEVSDAGRIAALAVLGARRAVRHRLVPTRQLFLAETGVPALDKLCVEHNGVLAAGSDQPRVLRAILAGLRDDNGWDELCIGGIDSGLEPIFTAAAAPELRTVLRWRKPYYLVAASDLPAGADYLSALSGNTRYQIRRAMRDIAAIGALQVSVARDLDDAEQFFSRLIDLHQVHWEGRGQPGAFATEFARHFHRRLIADCLPRGEVELVQIAAGNTPIGYLYNFVYRGTVFSYQSGFNYGLGSKLKPGLVSHCLAIERNLAQGASAYDLLMGRSQYKEMLATRSGEMSWLVLQRRRLRFALEDAARRLALKLDVRDIGPARPGVDTADNVNP